MQTTREEDKAEAQTRNDLLLSSIHNVQAEMRNSKQELNQRLEGYLEKLDNTRQEFQQTIQDIQETHIRENQALHTKIQNDMSQLISQTKEQNTAVSSKIDTVEGDLQKLQENTHDEFRQIKTDIKYTEYRVNKNEQKIESVERKVQEDFELLKTTQFEQMRRDLENLKGQGNRMGYTEGNGQHNPLLKLEHWPKYKGISDPLHPITFLRSIIRITKDISESQRLNLIRFTLKESALEWFEMVGEKCQNIDDFQTEFMKQFWNKNHQDKLKVRLLTGKYREGVISRELYACNLYNKCKHIDNFTEEDITRQLTTHFIYTDTQTIFCQDMKTMEDLLSVLRRLDDITDMGINRQTNYTPRYNTQRTRTPPPYNRFNNYNNNRYNNPQNSQNYRNQGPSANYHNNNYHNNNRPNNYNQNNNQTHPNHQNTNRAGYNSQNYRSNNGNRNSAQLNNIYGRSRPRRGNFNGGRSPRRSRSYEQEGTRYEDAGDKQNSPAGEKKTPISSEQERYCQPSTSTQNM